MGRFHTIFYQGFTIAIVAYVGLALISALFPGLLFYLTGMAQVIGGIFFILIVLLVFAIAFHTATAVYRYLCSRIGKSRLKND